MADLDEDEALLAELGLELTPIKAAARTAQEERLIAGFDRVYAQAKRSGEWGALDPATGKGLDLGSLPRSPNYGSMVFADEWFGAVELPAAMELDGVADRLVEAHLGGRGPVVLHGF